MKKIKNIGIVTRPVPKAGIAPLLNLTIILSSIMDHVFLITSGEGKKINYGEINNLNIIELNYKLDKNVIFKFIQYLYMALETTVHIFLLRKKVDTWIFFLESHVLIFPLLMAKITSKSAIILLGGSLKEVSKTKKDPLIHFSAFIENIGYRLADNLIVYSKNFIKEWELEKYGEKVIIAHRHFLNFNKFKIIKKYNKRKNLIGHIGRLTEVKGTMEFLHAINLLMEMYDDVEFLICGEGNLKDEVMLYLEKNNLKDKVKYNPWISHDDLPYYLNELKLLVLPSYTEGLPNIMLESMACGTPVLATPVGAIPDVIFDEETGFIMENNSPECIAKNIMRSIESPKLEKISNNASYLTKTKFERDNLISKWFNLFKEL